MGRKGRLRIRYASLAFPSGYGEAARRLIHALVDAGVAVEWVPITFRAEAPLLPAGSRAGYPDLEALRSASGRPDVVVVHAVPELLPFMQRLRPPGAALIASTVWEAPELQAHWPGLLNTCDGVMVPTEWNAAAFRAAGITTPMAVLPFAVSLQAPDAAGGAWLGPTGIDVGTSFVVHSIAAWNERKSPWRTVEAYARAFSPTDDTVLVLRTDTRIDAAAPTLPGPDSHRRLTSWSVADILHRHAPTGRVHLEHAVRSASELTALHERSGCWLSLPHAEGWDLGAFDAAGVGTPVVTTGHGGPLAYLDAGSSFLVPGRPVAASGIEGATWVEPDIDVAIDALRRIRADPEGARRSVAAQAERIQRRHAPPVIAARFLESLGEMGII